MLEQGKLVVYGIHGVCKVLGVEEQTVNRKKVAYYVLSPMKQETDRFFVPVQNAAAVAKLKPVLTRQELDALLTSSDADRDIWIVDENQRKQKYKELINSGDRAALVSMVKSLHIQKAKQLAEGRKFHLCDENFLRDAESLLGAEFSLILGIAPSEVGDYIQSMAVK